jgi:hypothetical protein
MTDRIKQAVEQAPLTDEQLDEMERCHCREAAARYVYKYHDEPLSPWLLEWVMGSRSNHISLEACELAVQLMHQRAPLIAEVRRLRAIECAAVRYISETGVCVDAPEHYDDNNGTCDDEGCEYCRLIRAVDEVNP